MNDRDERGSDVLGETDAFDAAEINENDTDPTAGASDIGGRAGDANDDEEPTRR